MSNRKSSIESRQSWAEWATGIAGAAKLIYRGGRVRSGTLRCSRCGKHHQLALWAGNQCKACYTLDSGSSRLCGQHTELEAVA